MRDFDQEDAPISGDALVAILAWAIVFLAAAELIGALARFVGRWL